jgi:hypothetical protein
MQPAQWPSPEQLERARRLLAYEGGDGAGADDCATAAGRVYDKLHAQVAPLLGSAGFQALLVRSAKLTRGELAGLGEFATLESSTGLRECLRASDPAAVAETAATLFGTFLALIATFIGERLTTQILRSAWPAIEETAAEERKK